jgi:RNA polymerase sigma-70 factor (ECF subfamily)
VFFWARRSGLRDPDAADVITRNKLHDHFRAQAGKAEAAGGTEAREHLENVAESEPRDESGVADQGLLHRTLELIREEFEERTWRAFWRMTVDNRSATEVGQELGLTANAVHQAKFRVLRRLREEMSGIVEM